MKKILLLTITVLPIILLAQQTEPSKKYNEYTYFGIKAGIVNNLSFNTKQNNYILINSPYGDLLKTNAFPFTYSPAFNFSLIYHIDSKNDRRGFVIGLSAKTYSFSAIYKPDQSDLNFKVKRTFTAVALSIPIYLKFNTKNIYRNQSYFTIGAFYNIYPFVIDKQKANWSGQKYLNYLPKDDTRATSLAAFFGFNYKIYFFEAEYLIQNFINTNYRIETEEGVIEPYNDIGLTNNLYLTFGINIPLTRWFTARNWTAEQIRRALKPKR